MGIIYVGDASTAYTDNFIEALADIKEEYGDCLLYTSTSFVTNINSDYTLDFNGKVINCDLTKVIHKSSMKENVLVDENNEAVDTAKLKVMVSIQPYDIRTVSYTHLDVYKRQLL